MALRSRRGSEVESGRKADRPELHGCDLGDRDAGSAEPKCCLLLALRESGVMFVAVDMPEANDLTVGIKALEDP